MSSEMAKLAIQRASDRLQSSAFTFNVLVDRRLLMGIVKGFELESIV
jgi:hypothetical protein